MTSSNWMVGEHGSWFGRSSKF